MSKEVAVLFHKSTGRTKRACKEHMSETSPKVVSRGGIRSSISSRQGEGRLGVGVCVTSNMTINADSSGWEEIICQDSVQLYQSVNSHNYDENFTVRSLLDFCCELHFLTVARQTQRQSNGSVMVINHATFCGVMSKCAHSASGWNIQNNPSVHQRQLQWFRQYNKHSEFWWDSTEDKELVLIIHYWGC